MMRSKYSLLIDALYAAAASSGRVVEISPQSDCYAPPAAPANPGRRSRCLKARDPEREAAAQAKRDRKAAKRAAQLKSDHA